MYVADEIVLPLAALLRTRRNGRGMTIAALAAEVGVSPRLISEFERGERPHVSLQTAMLLLQHVGVRIGAAGSLVTDEATARAERAARRRQTWSGSFSTLDAASTPAPPNERAERLLAVAQASQLASGLRAAYQSSAREAPADASRSAR